MTKCNVDTTKYCADLMDSNTEIVQCANDAFWLQTDNFYTHVRTYAYSCFIVFISANL